MPKGMGVVGSVNPQFPGGGARRSRRLAWLLLAPALLWSAALLVYPIWVVLSNSVHRVQSGLGSHHPFVGLRNYAVLLHDPVFYHVVKITLVFSVFNIAGSFGMGLLTALLLNQNYRARYVFQPLFLIPWAVPQIVAVLIWRWLLDYQYGPLGYLLWRLGLVPSPHIAWLIHPNLALIGVIITTVWVQYPIATTFLLAGLKTISPDLIDAARVDGASAWQRFRNIVWPHLSGVRNILLMLLIFWSLGQVVVIWAMTQGGPARGTDTAAIMVYIRAFQDFRIGNASALSVMVLVVSLAIGLVYYRYSFQHAKKSGGG